ncbi:tail fiber protein [Pseudomonas sp. G34]|uniref:tail fiber protein n=1 Tax=Pseudomonas sp. G34 TaxID=3059083 RepID=UPI002809153F|nr:tail fiber protein [Pseudomonas sp. G34]MDQ7987292.1 tail fiber protein [Pseudomonas sp. G34]
MALNITITNAGRAEIIAAENNGTNKVTIAAVALGTARYTPQKSQAALQAEVKRVTSIAGKAVADDTIHVMALDESDATYNVGEFGLISDKGTLIAVYSQLPEAGWIIQKAPASTLLLATDIILESLGTAAIQFGDITFINPPATIDTPGVVQLEDSLTSSSRVKALTAAMGKKLQDEKEANIAAGASTQYWRGNKTWRDFATDVRAAVLTGLSTASSTAVAAADTVLVALGKLQAQITSLATSKLDTTANAASATKLQTARTIGGVAFDGTANINLPGVNTGGNQSTSGNAATATRLQNARTIGGAAFDGTANINLPGVNTIGNQNTTGNAATSTKLQTARAINGVEFDGSAPITIEARPAYINIAANTDLDDLIGFGDYFCPANVTVATLANCPTHNAFYLRVSRHAGARQELSEYPTGFSRSWFRNRYGTVWGNWYRVYSENDPQPDVTGNAGTASKLQVARTINGVPFDGSAPITVQDGTKLPTAGGTLTGRVITAGSRDSGLYGNYNPALIDHVWSMGNAYRIADDGSTFGNLYGLAYKHTTNTSGGAMAFGHQLVLCSNGTPCAAIGFAGNFWTSGTYIGSGAGLTDIPQAGVAGLVVALAAKAALVSPAFTGTPTAATPPLGNSSTRLATTEFVQDNSTPKGTVAHFAMSSPPAGWLKANGAAVSRATYSDLFAAIGTTFGAGNGSSTFNLPDLRGEFIRSWSDGRTDLDGGRSFGTVQDQLLQGHTHSGNATLSFLRAGAGGIGGPAAAALTSLSTDSTSGGLSGETRPHNIALLACIRY